MDVEGPVTAVAVRTPEEVPGRRARCRAACWPTLTCRHGRGRALLAVLAPAAQAAHVARLLHGLYGMAAGIGGPRDDPGEAWQSWREALLALRVAEHVGRHAPVADWSALGVYRLLARLTPRDLADLAAESAALTPRIAASVEAYLDHAGQVQETAAALGVHRQTLYYRLGKAGHLTGLDLADGEDRLLLHLSLKAAALLPSHP
ncbi:hypothetical protein B1L11_36210 [Microbispora sp. GKU 823]|nr:hypothetical protein B1L11_36210 [Microbispora sp. GKU 823]